MEETETTPKDTHHCLICYSETIEQQRGILPCKHNFVCGLCHLRLRFLHDDKRCPICKQTNDKIVVDTDTYDENTNENVIKDFEMYRMYADDPDIMNDLGPNYFLRRDCGTFFLKSIYDTQIVTLFTYRCYATLKCKERSFNSRKPLEQHLKSHNLFMCDLCISNKRDFISNLPRFTAQELKEHHDKGLESIPGDKGHPTCKFCVTKKNATFRFYDVTKLYDHLNKEHYKCHVCERNEIQNQFFDHYKSLERHFDSKHFLCKHPTCLVSRFVVFDNDIALKAHERSVHGVVNDSNNSTKIQVAFNIRRQGHDGSGYDLEEQVTPSVEDFNFSLEGQPTTLTSPPVISDALHAARTAQIISDAARIRERQEEKEREEAFPSLNDNTSAPSSGWVSNNSNVRKPPGVKGRVQPQDFPSLPSVKTNQSLVAARQSIRNNGTKWSSAAPPARTSSNTTGYAAATSNNFPSLTPTTSTVPTNYAKKQLPQPKKKPSLDSANDFPSLSSSKPKSKTPSYQAATNYAKKIQTAEAVHTANILQPIAPKKPPPKQQSTTPQFTSNNFPSLSTINDSSSSNKTKEQLLTLPEIKALLPTPTYKQLRSYLKQLASNEITIQSFLNQSKELFTSNLYEDVPLFWKVIPSVVQTCPEEGMRNEGMKYLETLRKRDDERKNTVFVKAGGKKKSAWSS